MAIVLALLSVGCGTGSLNTFDDFKEGMMALTGDPVTAQIRLERILTAHDRTEASSWPLRPTEDGESQLRWVLRDIEKLEATDFTVQTARLATILVLGDVGVRSQSALVRARAAVAVARLGASLDLDAVTGPRAVDDAMLRRIFKGIKQADGAVPPAGQEDTPELRTSRRAALLLLAGLRFWPPESFDPPLGGRQDTFRTGRKWSRSLLDIAGSVRFQPDREDPAFGPEHEALLVGLAAEVVRYTVTNALLRDPDEQVRFDAVGAALEVGTPDMVPALSSAVRTESRHLVRFRLAQGLGEIGGTNRTEAVPALVTLLRDVDESVRHAAHESLTAIAGEDVGEDPASWLTWWAAHKPTGERS